MFKRDLFECPSHFVCVFLFTCLSDESMEEIPMARLEIVKDNLNQVGYRNITDRHLTQLREWFPDNGYKK